MWSVGRIDVLGCCKLVCDYFGLCTFVIDFFFQAEDGIRDLVRSRGLGDVYKRQSCNAAPAVSGNMVVVPANWDTHSVHGVNATTGAILSLIHI